MTILRNSARCDTCGAEVESKHRHDFRPHYCPESPVPALEWVNTTDGDQILVKKDPSEITWNFAVDGGLAYVRRLGSGFTDTSIYET